MKLADAVGRNSLVLGLVALAVTLALAGTQLLTREQIAAQRRAAEARAYNEILPPATCAWAAAFPTIPTAACCRSRTSTASTTSPRARA